MYSLDNDNLEFKNVKNIFTKIKFVREILENRDLYYPYEMKEGDTPEIIAHKLYNDPNRHWIVCFANQILDPYYDFPLSYESFKNYIVDKYGSESTAKTTLHHYESQNIITTNKNGLIDSQTYTTELANNTYNFSTGEIESVSLPAILDIPVSMGTTTSIIPDYDNINITITNQTYYLAVSCYEYENGVNEAKRKINLIKPEYVGSIETEFKKLML